MAALPQALQQFAAVIRGLSPAKRLTLLTLGFGHGRRVCFSHDLVRRGGTAGALHQFGSPGRRCHCGPAQGAENPLPHCGGRTNPPVPAESLHEIRMQMASEGLPQGSGIGFEVFDNTKLA